MQLLTASQSKQLQKQYPKGSSFDQKVVVKLFDPQGSWEWYLMNQDPEDPDYLWGIVKGFEVESGSISLSDLQTIRSGPFKLGIERDLSFRPRPAQEIWNDLMAGKAV